MRSIDIPILSELIEKGERPEYLFWIGCAGSFDDNAKKITKAFIKILHRSQISFAILGTEELCTGDPAKRAGNDFLFQMQALSVIQKLNEYQVTKIVTTCPHCLNTFKNEYPALGGQFEVVHHTQFIKKIMDEGKINISDNDTFNGQRITYHDPCYLSRANNIHDTPRALLSKIDVTISEMKKNRKNSMCCGAGGAQMFKESEKGNQDINEHRTQQALDTQASIIATGCPFCKTMLTDGVNKQNNNSAKVLDIAELIAQAEEL